MGQLGFFDLNRRYESLTEKNDPLVAIAAMVPFESFRPKLNAALIKGELRRSEAERKNSAGRKPWDEVVIFKALVLQALFNLSDDQVEYQLRDASPSCAFSVWSWRMRFPTPRLCGSIARRWPRRARWKSCSICLMSS
jgi:hypothetical protein